MERVCAYESVYAIVPIVNVVVGEMNHPSLTGDNVAFYAFLSFRTRSSFVGTLHTLQGLSAAQQLGR